MEDFEEAVDKVMMGVQRKSVILSEEEKKLTAYHEAGHALVASVISQISVAANDISGQLTQINEEKTDIPDIKENGAENKTKKTKTKDKN